MKKYSDQKRANLLHQAALMRARGKSLTSIASQLKIHMSTLHCFIRDYGQEWNAAYAAAVALVGEVPHHRGKQVSGESIDTAARMQAGGKSQQEIAEHFGISVATVQVWRADNRQRWDTAYLSA